MGLAETAEGTLFVAIDVYVFTGIKALSEDVLNQAAVSSTGSVIVCDISDSENVFPMVPPGNAMNDQMFSSEDV